MKNNLKIIILVVVIAILGLVVYFTNKVNPVENTPISTAPESLLGCYVAHIGKDVYTLVINSDENGNEKGMLAYNNYQKDSSSGSFSGTFSNDILLGDYSFDSEGMHSERQVIFKKVGTDFIQGFGTIKNVGNREEFANTDNVSYDPQSTFKKSENCIENFTDGDKTFSFSYNPFFQAFSNTDATPTLDWRMNTTQKGILLATVIIPKTFAPMTNFSEAKLRIGRSSDSNIIKSCTTTGGNGETEDGTKTIGGHDFTKFLLSDAGAGNFYETTDYRGIVDGDCYSVEYTVHSTNIGNYSPDQGIKEFDNSQIHVELEKIIDSLKFMISSN